MPFVRQYKIRIRYKSGRSESFWADKFKCGASSISWTTTGSVRRPIDIGFDNIESIWQVGTRIRWRRREKPKPKL